jgi:L-threonylcarbamoyladenylate synthase
VLRRSQDIPDRVTGGGPTVGLRCPSHPLIQSVIRACAFPLAAPSANLSNQVSPTNAQHVFKDLGDKIRLIVDGGQSQIGIESTVLDLTGAKPRILRPGMIHAESLLAVTGELAGAERVTQGAEPLRSPGLLPRHYAPGARLVVLQWRDDRDLLSQLAALDSPGAGVHVIAHTRVPSGENLGRVSIIPHDAEAFARALYAELHRCDEDGARFIVVEAPPETAEWSAINDRLRRATG